MSKFKLGDRVKVIYLDEAGEDDELFEIGSTGTIVQLWGKNCVYDVKFDSGSTWSVLSNQIVKLEDY